MLKSSVGVFVGAVIIAQAIVVIAWLHSPPLGYQRQSGQPNSQATVSQHGVFGGSVANAVTNEQGAKGHEQKGWIDYFLDHLPDWFVAAFTGLLVYVTARLVGSTNKLWEATNGLLKFAGQQAEDMKEAISASKRAADAADRSAKISGDALTKLQRAFVVLKEIKKGEAYREADSAEQDVMEQQFIPVTLVLENSGATPTRRLRTQATFAEFKTKEGPGADFKFFDADIGTDPVSFVIGPKATSRMSDLGISFGTLERI
jgi:hypothetical protein